jgi:hypothetical protein
LLSAVLLDCLAGVRPIDSPVDGAAGAGRDFLLTDRDRPSALDAERLDPVGEAA